MLIVQKHGYCMATVVRTTNRLLFVKVDHVAYGHSLKNVANPELSQKCCCTNGYSIFQLANHQKIFMTPNGPRNKFANGKAFAKAETLFCLYCVWNPSEWQTLPNTGASIRTHLIRLQSSNTTPRTLGGNIGLTDPELPGWQVANSSL